MHDPAQTQSGRLGDKNIGPCRAEIHDRFFGNATIAALCSGCGCFREQPGGVRNILAATDAALLVPQNVFPANGYLWIPKGAQHPILAQIFINWRTARKCNSRTIGRLKMVPGRS